MQQKLKETIPKKQTLQEDLERNLLNLDSGTQIENNARQRLYRADRCTYKMQQKTNKQKITLNILDFAF